MQRVKYRLTEDVEVVSCNFLSQAETVHSYHKHLVDYNPTPLYTLDGHALGLGRLYVKDESQRFGLKAFKALGASYATHILLKENPYITTFCTATDGNHGKAVAWAAARLGRRAKVYVPKHTVTARIRAIEEQAAEVVVVDGDYDTAVRQAELDAHKNGWTLVQDTAWPGYESIPELIMAGYLTQFLEIEDQIDLQPDLILLQAGVGSWAAAAACYYRARYGKKPILICVEPIEADCILESAKQGRVTSTTASQQTIMAGLNCGTPSTLAFEILKASINLFLAIDDSWTIEAMKLLYANQIVSGESGAAGLAGLLALLHDNSLQKCKEHLGITASSTVLVFNSEGDTDPESFQAIMGKNSQQKSIFAQASTSIPI